MSVLDRLEALRTEATPGPWAFVPESPLYEGPIVAAAGALSESSVFVAECSPVMPADAALIVAAVNALPALLRIARAARDIRLEIISGAGPRTATVNEIRSALSDLEAA